MQGTFVDLKDIEGVENYSAAFSIRGEEVVTPIEIFNRIKLPEDLHYSFTITPMNPADKNELVLMNKAVRKSYSNNIEKEFGASSGDFYNNTLEPLAEKIKAMVKDKTKSKEIEKLNKKYADMILKTNQIWYEAKLNMNIEKIVEFIGKYTLSVDKMLIINSGKKQQYTGEVSIDIIGAMQPEVRVWLFDEIARISQLSESEHLGL